MPESGGGKLVVPFFSLVEDGGGISTREAFGASHSYTVTVTRVDVYHGKFPTTEMATPLLSFLRLITVGYCGKKWFKQGRLLRPIEVHEIHEYDLAKREIYTKFEASEGPELQGVLIHSHNFRKERLIGGFNPSEKYLPK